MKMLFNIVGLAALILVALINAPSIVAQTPNKSDDAYLNIPDGDIEFNDRPAPQDQVNVDSQQYNEFIHKLYRFDAENLQKFDSLHPAAP